jgi:uncharacterized protein YjiK
VASRKADFAQFAAIALLGLSASWSQAEEFLSPTKLGDFTLDSDSLQQWKLPKILKEISGLALTPDDRLFAINDEQAIIYELDYEQGMILKTFALGRPIPSDDFEGIAYLDGHIYLVTSAGLIYVTTEGNDGERVEFEVYQTGLGRFCEIEGLAQDPQSGTLLMACKKSKKRKEGGRFSIFSWSVSDHRVLHDREMVIPEYGITERIGTKHVRPSAIVVDPRTSYIYGVAGPQQAIFQLAPDGELIDAIILPLAERHRQPEGIEITRDGKLLIADEGGDKKARLGVYAPGNKKTTDQQQ